MTVPTVDESLPFSKYERYVVRGILPIVEYNLLDSRYAPLWREKKIPAAEKISNKVGVLESGGKNAKQN